MALALHHPAAPRAASLHAVGAALAIGVIEEERV
jgi:hypothetical protein